MRLIRDIANQRFGSVVAVELHTKDDHGHAVWRVRCDCGREFGARSYNLTEGKTKSCGPTCPKKDKWGIHVIKD